MAMAGALAAAFVPDAGPGDQREGGSAISGRPIAAAVTGADLDIRPDRPLDAVRRSAIIIPRSADGLYYVDARIGENSVRFLVDTGANVTVLTQADAQRLGLAQREGAHGATLQTVGGPTAMRWARIPSMNVADTPVTDVDAAIIDQGIKVSLLGQNVLSRLDGMTFSGNQLRFH